MKKILLLHLLLLTGCAQMIESMSSLGEEAPKDAPPGHFTFVNAQKWVSKNDFSMAAFDFCNAAELGHPLAKSKCIEYAYLAAINDPMKICKASDYDKQADKLCSNLWWGKPSKSEAEQKIREAAKARERAKEAIKRRNEIKKAVEEGKYKLEAEDF